MIEIRFRKIIRQFLILCLNIFYMKDNEICPVSKINSNCEKQIILLIISNEGEEG